MIFRLFDHELHLKEYSCSLNGRQPYKFDKPYINMYVRLSNTCNASCKFCAFCGHYQKFDVQKFKYVLKYINDRIRINKLSFTGGEPTGDFSLFKEMLSFVNELNPNIFTVVNTNGLNLSKMDKLDINSIALSRHHYDDDKNNELFNITNISADEIANFAKDNSNLHLSCNLVKGYIDSQEEVLRYLDWCDSINARDVGFVSLMSANDFCKERFIDYTVITSIKNKRLLKTKEWCKNVDNPLCRCNNYVYMGSSGDFVRAYARYYVSSDNAESQLVFDGDCLKDGFNGKVLY